MSCVLRVSGKNLDLDALLQSFPVKAFHTWRKGEPRVPTAAKSKITASVLMLFVLGIVSGPAHAQQSSGLKQMPPPQRLGGVPPAVICEPKPLSLDMPRLRHTDGVQDAILDSSKSKLTVLFADGDVLLVGSSGCDPSVSARLLVTHENLLTDLEWRQKIKDVASLVLSPMDAERVNQSIGTAEIKERSGGGISIDSGLASRPGYWATVSGIPLDGLGRSMSIVYLRL